MYFCVQAIEDEGGDPDNIELTVSADTPTRKHGKSKGKSSLSELNSFNSQRLFFTS